MTNKQLPKAGELVEAKKFIHISESGHITYWDNDLSHLSGFGACLGETTISFIMPDGDPVESMVKSLKEQIKTERAEHHVKVTDLEDKIQRLLSIGYEKPEPPSFDYDTPF